MFIIYYKIYVFLYTFISVLIYIYIKNYTFSNPTIQAGFSLVFSFSELVAPFSNSEKPDFHCL